MTQSEHDIYKLNFAAQLDINFLRILNSIHESIHESSVFGFDQTNFMFAS